MGFHIYECATAPASSRLSQLQESAGASGSFFTKQRARSSSEVRRVDETAIRCAAPAKLRLPEALARLRQGAQLLNLSGNCLAIAPVSASATVYMWSFIAAQVCASWSYCFALSWVFCCT